MLPAGLLFPRSGVGRFKHTLSTKRFTLDAVMFGLRLSPCGGEKKTKKNRGGKNSFLGGRKKHSLKKIACGVGLQRFLRVCFFVCELFAFSFYL